MNLYLTKQCSMGRAGHAISFAAALCFPPILKCVVSCMWYMIIVKTRRPKKRHSERDELNPRFLSESAYFA